MTTFIVPSRLFKNRSRHKPAWYNLPIMGKLGLPELLIILVIVVLIFGANKLPELGRGIGKGIKNFKDATKEGAEDKS